VILDSIFFAQYDEEGGGMGPLLLIAILVIFIALVIVMVMLRRETRSLRKGRGADTKADRPPQ
jgi:hypothetical protein